MVDVVELFNVSNTLTTHPSDWFEHTYDYTLEKIKSYVTQPESVIIMTSAGMEDLRKTFPNAILLDIGSAFDVLAHKASRSYNIHFTTEDVDNFIQEIQNRS